MIKDWKNHSLLVQAPSHLQSEVHLNPLRTHLQDLQDVLQVQLMSTLHALLASSNSVQNGIRWSAELLFHPQSLNGGRTGWRTRAWTQLAAETFVCVGKYLLGMGAFYQEVSHLY